MANERLRAAITTAELSIETVAEEAGVDPKTVARWVSTGRLPHRTHRQTTARLLQRDVAYLWPETIDNPDSRRASHAELVDFYPSRAAVARGLWRSLLEEASERIEILVYAGQFLVDSHPDLSRLLVDKSRSGARVRLLFGDPSSEAVQRRGDEEGIGADLSARIRLSMSGLAAAIGQDGVELRLHDTTLYCSTYRFDDDLFVNTHVLGAPAAHSPVLHLRSVADGRLVEQYATAFERVWADARATNS